MTRGRPTTPILSRELIIEAALDIIDSTGLDSLTTRRLADKLGVKGASLYNHFRNKQEIVLAVAESVMGRVPRRMVEGRPVELLMWGNERLRRSLLAHPELTSVLAHQRETGMAAQLLDSVAERLLSDGVPPHAIMPLFESLERFAIGSAIREVNSAGTHSDYADSEHYPSLAIAAREQPQAASDVYSVAVHGIIDAILRAAETPDGFAQYRLPDSGQRATSSAKREANGRKRPASGAKAPKTATTSNGSKPAKQSAPKTTAARANSSKSARATSAASAANGNARPYAAGSRRRSSS